MSEAELYPGRVSPLGLGTIPYADMHGAWAMTLLDSAAKFKVNLTRPITPKTDEVVRGGKLVHKRRTLAVSEATPKGAESKLLAFGTETCSIFPAANPSAR